MDTVDSIGTTFHPLIQHGWNFFFKSLTNRKWTFPLESFRVQWIRCTPSERLSTPSSNMSRIFLSLSRTENELFHRNLFVSNGSDGLHRNDFPPPSSNMSGIFLSLSRIENELFHRNLFVSNASKHLVGLYTTRLPVFRWKARGYDWILVDSIGQPSISVAMTSELPQQRNYGITYFTCSSISRHWEPVLPKSFTGAFSSNSHFDVRHV